MSDSRHLSLMLRDLLATGVIGALGAVLSTELGGGAAAGALSGTTAAAAALLWWRGRVQSRTRDDAHSVLQADLTATLAAAQDRLSALQAELEAVRSRAQAAEAEAEQAAVAARAALRMADEDARELVQQAQAALEARAQFLANISHELRTPMNAVLGMAELLQQGALVADHRRMVDAISDAGQQLLVLINDVLDFSRLETQSLSLDVQPLDLRHVVESVVGMFSEAARRKGIFLGYVIDEAVPEGVEADASRLRQVLINLLSNAVKFTHQGSIMLRITGTVDAESQVTLLFSIQDTGIGIEPSRLEALFQPFEQQDISMRRGYGGAGLGLPISRSLAEMMGGRLTAESQPGVGSTFRVSLRLPIAHVKPEAGLSYPGARRTILCAHLTPLQQEILVNQTRVLGVDVVVAEDAADSFVEALRAQPVHAVAVGVTAGRQGRVLEIIQATRAQQAPPDLILIGEDIGATLLAFAGDALVLPLPLRITALQEGLARLWDGRVPSERTRSYEPTLPRAADSFGGRILLVEDNPVNQGVARRMLERLGCTVTLVDDGSRAVDAWRSGRFEAILMDCQMPGWDGYQATAEIRREEAQRGLRRTPIIAITAHAMQGDRGRCLEAGMDDYLSKPFSQVRLQEILAPWLVRPGDDSAAGGAEDALRSPFSPELLDPAAVEEALSLGGEETLVELIAVWLETSTRLMTRMEVAAKGLDAEGLKAAVHTLKSSSGSLGARALHQILQDMDRLAAMGALEAAVSLLPEARARWEKIRDVTRSYAEQHTAHSTRPGPSAEETTPVSVGGSPILIIDDDPTIRLLICNALSGLGHPLVEACDGEEALALFHRVQPKLILLDVMLGGINGFEVCQLLREQGSDKNIPILMMTGLDDLGSIQQAYEAGATDFIIKPFHTQILFNRVRYLLRAHKAMEALRLSQNEIYTLAYYDTVTGLPNRLRFTEQLEEQLARAKRTGQQLTVMFIDLDRFKRINDTLGHPVGDQLLRCVADRLQAVLEQEPPGSMIARFGGDEFVLLHAGITSREASNDLARRLVLALQTPVIIDGNELVVTASLGMTHYPTNGTTADALLKDADVAMYQIKGQGGNGFQNYVALEGSSGPHRLELEAALRKALDNREFEVFYQPKLGTRTWAITSVEALIRWRHPVHGLVSPGQFIPLAEETGMIVPIGEWVLEEACRQLLPWVTSGQIGHVAVNLSARQFSDERLVERVVEILARVGFPRECLELEVTESMVINNVDAAIQTMRRLRELGIEIAIDDFGTGQSSLSYLQRFPVNSLKIDRSFVSDISSPEDKSPIADMVIALGRALQLRIVAEGVETTEQLSYLSQAGCDELQGYLISRPLPMRELETFIHSHQRRSA